MRLHAITDSSLQNKILSAQHTQRRGRERQRGERESKKWASGLGGDVGVWRQVGCEECGGGLL
eukprot:2844919-Rhodomonas_salina.1